ncbi:hypothetical protein DFJ73DRAFT_853507 [Zopfochytrium polystomum]|nr:hypothetical protein DFJ73DRAFT_853507 [Zopfochytrium polystomum]
MRSWWRRRRRRRLALMTMPTAQTAAVPALQVSWQGLPMRRGRRRRRRRRPDRLLGPGLTGAPSCRLDRSCPRLRFRADTCSRRRPSLLVASSRVGGRGR